MGEGPSQNADNADALWGDGGPTPKKNYEPEKIWIVEKFWLEKNLDYIKLQVQKDYLSAKNFKQKKIGQNFLL